MSSQTSCLKRLVATGLGLALFTLAAVGARADHAPPLVEVDWLERNLERPDLVVLDIRNRIDGADRRTFEAGHIPGAIYSSYTDDSWRVNRGDVVGVLPAVDALEGLIGGLGISNGDHVVIVPAGVSSSDFGSAARVYWTFRVLGHDHVSILDGGFKAWLADRRAPIEVGPSHRPPATFTARFQPQLYADVKAITAALADGSATLVDARPLPQFTGEHMHPGARRAGRIPGALHRPEAGYYDNGAGRLRPSAELAALLADVTGGERPIVSYCNTGHWAATNWFVLSEVLGRKDVRLYDGSMVDWTQDAARPVATGRP